MPSGTSLSLISISYKSTLSKFMALKKDHQVDKSTNIVLETSIGTVTRSKAKATAIPEDNRYSRRQPYLYECNRVLEDVKEETRCDIFLEKKIVILNTDSNSETETHSSVGDIFTTLKSSTNYSEQAMVIGATSVEEQLALNPDSHRHRKAH